VGKILVTFEHGDNLQEILTTFDAFSLFQKLRIQLHISHIIPISVKNYPSVSFTTQFMCTRSSNQFTLEMVLKKTAKFVPSAIVACKNEIILLHLMHARCLSNGHWKRRICSQSQLLGAVEAFVVILAPNINN